MSTSVDVQNSEYLLQESYSTMVLVISVAYDYLLTLPSEVEYIWCRRWTRVSTLFVLVRYLSLCYIAAIAFCTVFYLATEWTFLLFQVFADLVMILRVYAMSNRSKIILGVLLLLCTLQTVTGIVFYGMSNFSVTLTQALNATFCDAVLYSPFSTWSIVIPHLMFSLALFTFPVVQIFKQFLDIRKTEKRWKLGQYIKILMADGILYFFMHLCYDVRTLMVWRVVSLSAMSVDFLNASTTLLLLTMLPRFIIGIRELYDRDAHRRQDIDSGFGILSFVRVPDSTAAFVGVDSVPQQVVGEDTEGFGSDSTRGS